MTPAAIDTLMNSSVSGDQPVVVQARTALLPAAPVPRRGWALTPAPAAAPQVLKLTPLESKRFKCAPGAQLGQCPPALPPCHPPAPLTHRGGAQGGDY